jgi:hypothetical protein
MLKYRCMKYVLTIVLFLGVTMAHAQKNIPVTDQVSIEGKVKKPYSFSLKDARTLVSVSIDSITITNHLQERRGVIKGVKGVLLKDIIEKAEIDASNPKILSEYYIECIATDNYKVVFSWNELFNSNIGYNILVITEKDGLKGDQMPDRICLISSTDQATGRRYVKGLQRVIIKQVE